MQAYGNCHGLGTTAHTPRLTNSAPLAPTPPVQVVTQSSMNAVSHLRSSLPSEQVSRARKAPRTWSIATAQDLSSTASTTNHPQNTSAAQAGTFSSNGSSIPVLAEAEPLKTWDEVLQQRHATQGGSNANTSELVARLSANRVRTRQLVSSLNEYTTKSSSLLQRNQQHLQDHKQLQQQFKQLTEQLASTRSELDAARSELVAARAAEDQQLELLRLQEQELVHVKITIAQRDSQAPLMEAQYDLMQQNREIKQQLQQLIQQQQQQQQQDLQGGGAAGNPDLGDPLQNDDWQQVISEQQQRIQVLETTVNETGAAAADACSERDSLRRELHATQAELSQLREQSSLLTAARDEALVLLEQTQQSLQDLQGKEQAYASYSQAVQAVAVTVDVGTEIDEVAGSESLAEAEHELRKARETAAEALGQVAELQLQLKDLQQQQVAAASEAAADANMPLAQDTAGVPATDAAAADTQQPGDKSLRYQLLLANSKEKALQEQLAGTKQRLLEVLQLMKNAAAAETAAGRTDVVLQLPAETKGHTRDLGAATAGAADHGFVRVDVADVLQLTHGLEQQYCGSEAEQQLLLLRRQQQFLLQNVSQKFREFKAAGLSAGEYQHLAANDKTTDADAAQISSSSNIVVLGEVEGSAGPSAAASGPPVQQSISHAGTINGDLLTGLDQFGSAGGCLTASWTSSEGADMQASSQTWSTPSQTGVRSSCSSAVSVDYSDPAVQQDVRRRCREHQLSLENSLQQVRQLHAAVRNSNCSGPSTQVNQHLAADDVGVDADAAQPASSNSVSAVLYEIDCYTPLGASAGFSAAASGPPVQQPMTAAADDDHHLPAGLDKFGLAGVPIAGSSATLTVAASQDLSGTWSSLSLSGIPNSCSSGASMEYSGASAGYIGGEAQQQLSLQRRESQFRFESALKQLQQNKAAGLTPHCSSASKQYDQQLAATDKKANAGAALTASSGSIAVLNEVEETTGFPAAVSRTPEQKPFTFTAAAADDLLAGLDQFDLANGPVTNSLAFTAVAHTQVLTKTQSMMSQAGVPSSYSGSGASMGYGGGANMGYSSGASMGYGGGANMGYSGGASMGYSGGANMGHGGGASMGYSGGAATFSQVRFAVTDEGLGYDGVKGQWWAESSIGNTTNDDLPVFLKAKDSKTKK